mgnify:CR=1 FL=1
MIGKLSGKIDSKEDGHIILDVQGVGYVVFVSPRTLSNIPSSGESTSVLIDTHVREDHIHLYGFIDKTEQLWFRLLTSVQGVGAKVGLAILGACAPDKLQLAIAAQDKALLTQADGVGPKLATRIVTELKDKVSSIQTSDFNVKTSGTSSDSTTQSSASNTGGVDSDAVSALINLGYGRADAFSAVMKVRAIEGNDEEQNLQTLIRLALKELSA